MAALSRQSPPALLAPFGLGDVYGCNLVDDWEVSYDDGGAISSGHWKKLRSKLDRYRHLHLMRGYVKVPCSFTWMLVWLIASTASVRTLFVTPSGDIVTLVVTILLTQTASI